MKFDCLFGSLVVLLLAAAGLAPLCRASARGSERAEGIRSAQETDLESSSRIEFSNLAKVD
ncbi:MAG: hypothetical protein WBF42_04390, partial [Terracidiphilus sp.]